jgi:hypothetical protein
MIPNSLAEAKMSLETYLEQSMEDFEIPESSQAIVPAWDINQFLSETSLPQADIEAQVFQYSLKAYLQHSGSYFAMTSFSLG